MHRSVPAAVAWILVSSSQAHAQKEEHYVRPPVTIATATAASQFAVASDRELSVVLFVEDSGTGRVLASHSDGRGLPGTWSAASPVSDGSASSRTIKRESIHVIGSQAFAIWLEDDDSPAKTRLYFNRMSAGVFGTASKISDVTVPSDHDILDFACVTKPGLNGNPYVVVAFHTRNPGGDVRLLCSVSSNGGTSFGAPFAVSSSGNVPGAVATAIGGLSVDTQLGELHIAWSDDRNGPGSDQVDVFYRRGVIDFLGTTWFTPPLGTGNDTPISVGAKAVGSPTITVNGEFKWTGSNQKYVGIAWRELDKGPSAATLKVRASHDSGNTFLLPSVVAHTGDTGVAVTDFDFETAGDTFVVAWTDNARTVDDGMGGTTVVVPVPAESHVWHAESDDGTDFDPSQTGIVTMASAFEVSTNQGHTPRIARTVGNPDGSMIVFLEGTGADEEVFTTFSDQEFGGEWHIDEYPIASAAQGNGGGTAVTPPDVAYNQRYYNFLVAWQQETAPGSAQYDLVVGGYRPQVIEIEGWQVGSTAVQWTLDHLPFQDTFAFVLISGTANNTLSGNLALPDSRKTGLVADAFYLAGLQSFVFFAAPVDPFIEGAQTAAIPLPPTFLVEGLPLCFVGVTWGPFGDVHVLTDWFCETVTPADMP